MIQLELFQIENSWSIDRCREVVEELQELREEVEQDDYCDRTPDFLDKADDYRDDDI